MADQENDRLKQLCALPAEELASFIHGLSMLHDGVNESVDLFLLRKNSGELSKKSVAASLESNAPPDSLVTGTQEKWQVN